MKNNHLSKINQLPAEILVQIFLLSRNQTHKSIGYPQLRLSSVCRHWREVINGHGNFWTVIYFSPWKGEQFIRELVSRSRSAKLSVFSPLDRDICINEGSRRERSRIRDILTTFNNLLQTEGHRIKFLFLMEDRHHRLPKLVLVKVLPVLKTFIFKEADLEFPSSNISESLAIIKSAENLENLNITLQLSSTGNVPLLSKLERTFSRLKNLKIYLPSDKMEKQFFISFLPLCYKLESLVVRKSEYSPDVTHLQLAITLPNLLSLDVDCYTLVHNLHAPALRRLKVWEGGTELNQHDYLIFDGYDLSPVTQLSMEGVETFLPENSWILIEGSTGTKLSFSEDPWSPIEKLEHRSYSDIDFREDITLNPEQAEFYIWTRTHFLGSVAPDSEHSLLSKILPKLHNLEVLRVTPFEFRSRTSSLSSSDFGPLETFLKGIFDNVVSDKLQCLIVKVEITTLRVIFDIINGCSSLSNLDIFVFRTYRSSHYIQDKSLQTFGEELVNGLRSRQKAGYRTLSRFEVDSDLKLRLPKKWISEAAALGTIVRTT